MQEKSIIQPSGHFIGLELASLSTALRQDLPTAFGHLWVNWPPENWIRSKREHSQEKEALMTGSLSPGKQSIADPTALTGITNKSYYEENQCSPPTYHLLIKLTNSSEKVLSCGRRGATPWTTCCSWSNTLTHFGYGNRPVASSIYITHKQTCIKHRHPLWVRKPPSYQHHLQHTHKHIYMKYRHTYMHANTQCKPMK